MESPAIQDVMRQQVQVARRRLILEQFLHYLPGCLSSALLVALLGVVVPKLVVMSTGGMLWAAWWIGGSLVLGLVLAIVLTCLRAKSALDAAVELDRRFQLKERVSSMLALSAEERKSAAGRALVEDAERRAGGIDVKSEFGLTLGRRAWLPLVPAVLAFALASLLPDKENPQLEASSTAEATRKQVERSTEDLRRKMAERRRLAKEKGLDNAAGLFKRIEEETQAMKKETSADREKSLVKLNDLAKELEQRREAVGGSQSLQQQLNQLKNLQKGPADKLADAMRNGDLQDAQKELKQLQQQLKDGKLDKEAQEKLAQQMEQMQQKLQQAVDSHKQAMEDLQKQLQQAQAQGDNAQAQQLQQQLDKLAQQSQRMDQLSQMAQQLSQAAESMQQGDSQQAQQSLEQMTKQLQQLQQENDELEMLDEALEQVAQAKDSMNCKKCGGAGCKQCQGQGGNAPGDEGQDGEGSEGKTGKDGGQGQGDKNGPPGDGLGAGRGQGDRPEEKNDTGAFDTRVRQKVGPGQAVVTDQIEGSNLKGQVQEEVKAGISAARREESDPLNNVRLPRAQRDHAREYFDAFRGEDAKEGSK